jgi:hypothetical protein
MEYIKVRNWETWQSYRKDRGQPPWIKVHRCVMRNPEWVMLNDAERGQLVAMWLLAADHDGAIPASPELVQKLCFMSGTPNLNKFAELGFLETAWRQDGVNVAPSWRQGDNEAARDGCPGSDCEAPTYMGDAVDDNDLGCKKNEQNNNENNGLHGAGVNVASTWRQDDHPEKRREEKRRIETETTTSQPGGSDAPCGQPGKSSTKKPVKLFAADSDEIRLSKLLYTLILEKDPKAKKPKLQSWAEHIDLMIRIDKRTPVEIESVIRFCQLDPFWCANILSTKKLREKFTALVAKKRQGGRNGKSGGYFPENGSGDDGQAGRGKEVPSKYAGIGKSVCV